VAAKRKLIFGIALGALAAGGAVAGVVFLRPSSLLTPALRTGACLNVASDAGVSFPWDATTDGGAALWRVNLSGRATGPATLRIYEGDTSGPALVDQSISKAGWWTTSLPLSLGWHRLVIRATVGARTTDQVYWLGLGDGPPTWTAPGPWESGTDSGVVCREAGCYSPGVVPRCGNAPIIPSDAGLADALSDAWGDPIGCRRGCGSREYIPDAGCGETGATCPGLTDSGLYYRPRCCRQEPNAAGWRHTPDGGWCAGAGTLSNGTRYEAQSRGDILLSLNFAGLHAPGCGPGHLLVSLVESELSWPPGDAGHSHDAYLAARYRKYDYTCKVRRAGAARLPVEYNRDAGAAGVPFCSGNWCCVLSKIYPSPDSGT